MKQYQFRTNRIDIYYDSICSEHMRLNFSYRLFVLRTHWQKYLIAGIRIQEISSCKLNSHVMRE